MQKSDHLPILSERLAQEIQSLENTTKNNLPEKADLRYVPQFITQSELFSTSTINSINQTASFIL